MYKQQVHADPVVTSITNSTTIGDAPKRLNPQRFNIHIRKWFDRLSEEEQDNILKLIEDMEEDMEKEACGFTGIGGIPDCNHYSLEEVERYNTNPYLVESDGKTFVHTGTNVSAYIRKVDNVPDAYPGKDPIYETHIGKTVVVDTDEFDRVRFGALCDALSFGKEARQILSYLLKVVDSNGIALFDPKHQYQEAGYTSAEDCLLGLRELMADDIVRPHTEANTWWINPRVVCNNNEESLVVYAKYVIYKDPLAKD